VSKKIIDPQVAVRHRIEDAMKYAQALEDGYEWPDEVEIEGVGTLVAGRLFQISKPDVDFNHVRDLGWYQVRLIMKQAPHKIGVDYGYWGTGGTYLIQSKGPFNKNGTEKSRCRMIDFNIGEGASGYAETRIWKIAKGREAPNSKGVKLVKPVESNRAEKYADLEEWAAKHKCEQFTTAQLAEQAGFSTATILKYLKTSQHFTKVKQGLYESCA